MTDRGPGWDQQAISRISKQMFGGLREMFEYYGWEWTGNRAMSDAASLIKDRYGSIDAFADRYDVDNYPANPFENDPEILLTSTWGWGPEQWGCVGFTDEGRRRTISKDFNFPMLVVIYITENSPYATKELRGRVAGFYEITDIMGHRDEFTAPHHRANSPKKWQYAFKASRAFEIIPEYRPTIREFEPDIRRIGSEMPTSRYGRPLTEEATDKLKRLPYREVPVFDVSHTVSDLVVVPEPLIGGDGRGYVRGGAGRRSGYVVGEPKETEKELYVLKLSGDPSSYLGYDAAGRSIFKVGLSLSPETRRSALNAAMPSGTFKWSVVRTTRKDGHSRYSCFEVAEAGEMAMKKRLGKDIKRHLGGEFYLASEAEIEEAWAIGREGAMRREGKK